MLRLSQPSSRSDWAGSGGAAARRGRIPAVHRWRDAVAPTLLATTPLVGYSLIGDDKRRLYSAARLVGSDPLEAFSHSWDTIDGFLDRGNFRPLGRVLENIERSFVFDAAEATGLAPHAVIGVLRLAMVALLALVACRIVSAVVASTGVSRSRPHPAVVLYPMTLAATLVAADHDGPITNYPFMVVGSVVLILVTALAVARDKDIEARRLSWHEPVSMALLGAVAASTYDLLYLAPAVAAGFLVARYAASGRPARELGRSAALRRWIWLSVGFGVVFVPVRIEIAERCSRVTCYAASDIELSGDVYLLTAQRLLTGTPPAGWSHASRLVDESDLDFGLPQLATNSLLAFVMIAILLVAVRAARQLSTPPPPRIPDGGGDVAQAGCQPRRARSSHRPAAGTARRTVTACPPGRLPHRRSLARDRAGADRLVACGHLGARGAVRDHPDRADNAGTYCGRLRGPLRLPASDPARQR